MSTSNVKLNEAVAHYAEIMGLEVTDPQVLKYARGLSERVNGTREAAPRPPPANDRLSLRYVRAVRRYAESQGMDVRNEQVKKYARGLLNIFKDFRERPAAIEELGLLAGNDGEIDENKVLEAVK